MWNGSSIGDQTIHSIFNTMQRTTQCIESCFYAINSKKNMQYRHGKLFQPLECFLPHFPSSLPFLGNQPGQICGAQRAVCAWVSACGCVCVCVVLIWKILEGRLETEIGKDRENKSAPILAFPTIHWNADGIFSMISRFHWSWVQVRENNVSQSCRTSANFASGLLCNTPLLSSNSSIGLNWANPSSKGCLKFTKCRPCLTKKQVN